MNFHSRHGAVVVALFFGALACTQHLSPITAQAEWQNGSTNPAATATWNSGWGSDSWLGSSGANKNQWLLGVDASNTDVGAMVTRVNPGSAAARAGITPQDIIVSVGNSRVGRVGGRIFDLGEEIKRHADATGRVGLLVQNSQTMRLASMTVQLDSNLTSALTGTLLLPPNTQLPYDAVATVQLENVSRPHYVVRNGEYSFRVPQPFAGQIGFNLNYDRDYIVPNDTYRVIARIVSGGRTLYVTAQAAFVITRGNPNQVQLQLVPASSAAVAGASGTNIGSVYTVGYTNYDLITQRVTESYQRYLNRAPSSLELAAWHQVPDVEFRLTQLPLELMASQEYFDRVGDNNSVWIRKVFGEVIGRTPSALEFDQWMRRFADVRYSRMEVLKQMKSVKI
ncbi:MAG: YbaY family lipoprotein [Rubripirellula sp.]